MKFLADMGISKSTVAWLTERGLDSKHARTVGLDRATDREILDVAMREGRIVLTMDLDFAALLALSADTLPSVVLFRLSDQTPAKVNLRLASVLSNVGEALREGAIVTVGDTTIRVRRLPVQRKRRRSGESE